MLDEPDSLARLPEALKQIDPLVEARELLAVAQRKRKILGDIEKHPGSAMRLGVLRPGHHRSGRPADGAGLHRPCPAARSAQPQIDIARRHHRPARERVRGRHPAAESGQGRRRIRSTRRSADPVAEHRAAAVAGGRRRGAGRGGSRADAPPTRTMLTAQDFDIPDTADEFWNLREELTRQATELLGQARARPGGLHRRRVRAEVGPDRPRRRRQGTQAGRARRLGAARVRDDHARTDLRRSRCRLRRAALHRRADGPAARSDPVARRGREGAARRGSAAAGPRSALRHGAAVRQRDQHARTAAAAPRPGSRRRRAASAEPNTLAGKLFAGRPDACLRRRGRRRHRGGRGPHLRGHPRRVRRGSGAPSPTPVCTRIPTGWRSRTTGVRSSSRSTSTRVTSRQDRRADTSNSPRPRTPTSQARTRRRRDRRATPAVARPGRARARRSASSSRSGARSTPRPPTGTPTGCANSTSCCWPTTPTSRRSTPAPRNAGSRSRR